MNGAGASYGDLLITSLVVLGVVCVAAFVAVRVFGRLLASGRARGAHLMDVVARVPLEPRRSLYVVEVAGKTLLVGTSEMGLSVLSELDARRGAARGAAERTTFADLVKRGVGAAQGRAASASGRAGRGTGGEDRATMSSVGGAGRCVAIVPLVVLTLTSFVKLSVVLSLLRNAIGAPDAPSGLVVTGSRSC